MNNLDTIFITAAASVLGQIANFLPKIIGALIIFWLGLLVANWAKKLVVQLLTAIDLNKLLKNTGIHQFLARAEIPHALEEIIGQLVRWTIILIFFITTMNLLGLQAVSTTLAVILGYIPNVIAAIFILMLGILVAGLLEGVVKGALLEFDAKMGRMLGKVTSYTIMVFSILAALSQLKIAEQFIHTLFTGVVATLALGLGLAIGLGAKDTVSDMIKTWYKKLK